MRKAFASILLALSLPFLVAGFIGCSGCKGPETAAYRTSKTAHITAIAAIKAWGDYVSKNHPPVEQEKKVQEAFDAYKSAQLTLLDATKAYMAASATNTPPAAVQEKFDLSLQYAGDALANLIGLIQELGVKL